MFSRSVLILSTLFLACAVACSRSTTPDWSPYLGPVTVASDTRLSLWVPSGVHHGLAGPLDIFAAAVGNCPVTLVAGSLRVQLEPDRGWAPAKVPAGTADLSSESTCGAAAAVDLLTVLPGSGEQAGVVEKWLGRIPGRGSSSSSQAIRVTSRMPSLVLITIDTLRPDYLGSFGDPARLSPNLDRFAAGAMRFTRARAHAPWTGPSVAALMSGRQSAGLSFMAEMPPTVPTLAERLAAAGYRTIAAVNNPRLAAETGMNRGFMRYREFDDDEALVLSIPELLKGDGPTFVWAHLLGPHLPLDPSEEDLAAAGWDPTLGESYYQEDDSVKPDTAFSEPARRRIRTLYRADIHHADRNLGRILEAVDSTLPGAIVVITSDHGEELWEHGAHGHGHAFWRELLAVPLLIRGPGFHPGGVDDRLTPLCAVAPTLLKLAGVAGQSMECAPLDAPAQARWAHAGNPLHGPRIVSIEGKAWKMLREEKGSSLALFAPATDPAEVRDLRSAEPAVVDALTLLSRAYVDAAQPPRGSSRVALTLSGMAAEPLKVSLRSSSRLESLPSHPPGKWGRVLIEEDGKHWTIISTQRKPGPDGELLELVLAAAAPVSATAEVGSTSVPLSRWRVAGTPARADPPSIRLDQEGWRSDEPGNGELWVDLWLQPRGEPPQHLLFTPQQRERLRAIGYSVD